MTDAADRVRGTCPAVYPLGELADDTKHAFAVAQPSHACAHGGPDALVQHAEQFATDVHALSPHTEVVAGIGCDYWFGMMIAGRITPEACVERIMRGVRAAAHAGAIMVVIDLEASGQGGAVVRPIIAHALTLLYETIRAEFPAMIVGHTAYDVPVAVQWTDGAGHVHNFGGQGSYVWDAACGPGGATVNVPQVYVALGGNGVATIGAAKWRYARHVDSWAQAAAKWHFRADREDAIYVQAHHSTVDAIVWLGTRASFRMLWTMRAKGAGEETFDAHGLTALQALCKLDALGMTLDEFQRAHGLTADEDCGPKTLAAMGIA